MRTLVMLLMFIPPIVVIPPHNWRDFGWRQWWAYIPPTESLKPPTMWFNELHELDGQVCEGGPAQPAEYPNVLRCQGTI